ncbi:MAG: 3-oxoacyl-[acyl-carrier-protein] reductase [Vulcanimicrobiota bacterium]
MDNKGQVALVTGAGRGIGRSISLELAQQGFHIALNDINEADLEKVKAEINKSGVEAEVYQCDVSNSADVKKMVQAVAERFKRIDVLVNNAGITRDNLLVLMKEEDWDRVITINLKSVFNCTKAVAKMMMKQKSGRIISISSVVGVMGNAGQANYAASKAGIIGFTKAMAKELASRGITVNAVAPGFIVTEMTESISEEARQKLAGLIPLGFRGETSDVANAVAFLASPGSRYITGQVLHVDGGMVM